MAVTRLKRKDRKNRARANNRIEEIKQRTTLPPVKMVDIEAIKAGWAAAAKA